MNRIKQNSAITLIALVITIIVLLILAGLTLTFVLGENGLFGKARQAKLATLQSQAEEDVRLKILEYQTANNGEQPTLNQLATYLEDLATEEYLIKTSTSVSSLKEGSVSLSSIDASTNEIYVTKTSIGAEVKVTKDLQVEATSKVETASSGSSNSGGSGSSNSGSGSGENTSTLENKTLAGEKTGYSYKNPVIPGGFTTVDTDGAKWEYTDNTKTEVRGYNSGLVIEDEEHNEFVWVPCESSNYVKTNWGDSYKNSSWDSTIETKEEQQITTYGGFYVARYEAGTSNVTLASGGRIGDSIISASGWQNNCYVAGKTTKDSKPTSKKGEIPYYYADHGTAMVMSERMYSGRSNVESGLITGTQWDVMLNWLNDNASDKTMLTTGSNWGNYCNTTLSNVTGKYCTLNSSNGSMTSSWQTANWTGNTTKPTGFYILSTGSTEDVCKKNIYDVAGNLWEWTMETAGNLYSDCYMMRGGSMSDVYTNCPVCFRYSYTVSNVMTCVGFRIVLYVK